MKYRNYRVLALLLSASIASQPVSVSAATMKEVLEPDVITADQEETNETGNNEVLEEQGMSLNARVELEEKEEPVPEAQKGQVRNGLVKYDDQSGRITAGRKKVVLGLGEMTKLAFIGADIRDIALVSNKPSVVQVDIDGNIYGIKSGSATITAWYNGKKVRTRVKVTKNKDKGSVNVKEIYTGNGKKEKTPKVKGVKKSEVTLTTQDVSFTAQDLNDNSFSVNKKVLTFNTKYGSVSVDSYPENPTAKNTSVTVGVKETKTLIAEGVVEGIVWKSKKNKIARVDSLGRVTGIKPGKTKIVAKVGSKKLVYDVTVDSEKVPDEDPDIAVTQVRLNRFTSVNLSAGGRILDVVKTDSYDGKKDPYSTTMQSDCFNYKVIHHEDGSPDTIEITGITEDGKNQEILHVPAYINGLKVETIDESFPNKDVYYDKELSAAAISDDIRYEKYTNGDFEYRYKLQDGKLVVEILGLSEQGAGKNEITIPATINDRAVASAINAFIDTVGKDVTVDKQLAGVINDYALNMYKYCKGDVMYHFESDGVNVTTIIDALSHEGKGNSHVTVSGNINGAVLKSIEDGMLKDAEGKTLIFDDAVKASALPSTVSRHTYISDEGFKYRYKVVDDTIVTEITGVTDELKDKTDIEIPGTIYGKKVVAVDDSVFSELEGKYVTLAEDLDDSALPDTIGNHEFTDGDLNYRFVKDKDGKSSVELTGLTEEGKSKDTIRIPSNEGGRPVSGLSEQLIDDLKGKGVIIEEDVPSSILPDSFFDTTYTIDDYAYRYEKCDDGKTRPVITGLSDKGKTVSQINIPADIAGTPVLRIDDGIFNDAEGKKVTIDNKIQGKDVTDKISEHTYKDGDYIYRFVKNSDGEITVEVLGLSEEGADKESLTFDGHAADRDISMYTDKIFQDAEHKELILTNDVTAANVADSIASHQYTSGDYTYHFVADKTTGAITAVIDGLSEEGKSKDALTIPESIGGKKISEVTHEALLDMAGKDVTVLDPSEIKDKEYSEGDCSYKYVVTPDGKLKTEITGLSEEGKEKLKNGEKVNIPENIGGQEVTKVDPTLFDEIEAIIKEIKPGDDTGHKPEDFVEISNNPSVVYELYDLEFRILAPNDEGKRTAEIIGMSRYSAKAGENVSIPANMKLLGKEISSVVKEAVNSIGKKNITIDAKRKGILQSDAFTKGDFEWKFIVNDVEKVGAYITGFSETGNAKLSEGKLEVPEYIENLPVLAVDGAVLPNVKNVPTGAELVKECFVYNIKEDGAGKQYIEIIGIRDNHPELIEVPSDINGIYVRSITPEALRRADACDVIIRDGNILPSGEFKYSDYTYRYSANEYDKGRYVARIAITDVVDSAKESGQVKKRKQVGDLINNVKIGSIDPKARPYSITYDLSDKEINSQSKAVFKNKPVAYSAASKNFVIDRPTRSGYTFKGWTFSDGEEPVLDAEIKAGSDGDIHLKAHWEAEESTVQIMYLVPKLIKKEYKSHTVYATGDYEDYSTLEAGKQHVSGGKGTVDNGTLVKEITGKTGDTLLLKAPKIEGYRVEDVKYIKNSSEAKEDAMLASNSDAPKELSYDNAATPYNFKADIDQKIILRPESKNDIIVFIYAREKNLVEVDLAGGTLSKEDAMEYGFLESKHAGIDFEQEVLYGGEVQTP